MFVSKIFPTSLGTFDNISKDVFWIFWKVLTILLAVTPCGTIVTIKKDTVKNNDINFGKDINWDRWKNIKVQEIQINVLHDINVFLI